MSSRVCWWWKTTTTCMTRSLNVTPKTTLRSGKSEAKVTIIKETALYYYFVEAMYYYWRTQSIAQPLCNSSATCYDYRLWGLGVAGGAQIMRFFIDLRRRPYNTLALPCECVCVIIMSCSESVKQRYSRLICLGYFVLQGVFLTSTLTSCLVQLHLYNDVDYWLTALCRLGRCMASTS